MKNVLCRISQITCILLLFMACSHSDKPSNSLISGEPFKIQLMEVEAKIVSDSLYLDLCHIIPLQTTSHSLIHQINKIFVDDSILFILDRKSKKILMFDMEGKYLNQIFSVGYGPEEYIQIIDFTIDKLNKQVIVLCDRPYKLMYFSYLGEFDREEVTDELYLQIAVDNNFVHLESSELNANNQFQIASQNTKSGIFFNSIPLIPNINNSLFLSGISLIQGDNIYFTRRFDNQIYQIKEDTIVAISDIDFGIYKLPLDLMNEDDNRTFSKECSDHEYIYSINNIINSKTKLLINTNIGIFLYNKESKLSERFLGFFNSGLKLSIYDYTPLNGSSKLVCEFDPSEILHATQMLSRKDIDKLVGTINLATLKEDDNPVLFVYKLKE